MKTRKKKIAYSGNQVDIPYMEVIQNNLFNMSHPVESIFETTNSSCNTPENLVNYFKTLFGVSAAGTWERFGEGKVVVGYQSSDNDFNTIGGTGGSKLLQNHSHGFTPSGDVSSSFSGSGSASAVGNHVHAELARDKNGASSSWLRNYSGRRQGGVINLQSTDETGWHENSYVIETGGGGEHTHTITVSGSVSSSFSGSQGYTEQSGSGEAQNLQPYIVVYRYRRIS